MKFKAIKSFSNAYVGNITAGDEFQCTNDDLIHHFLEHKMIEPVADFAYQNKMLQRETKKKHPMDSVGSEDGKGKPSSASPAGQASPPDKSSTSEKEESKENAASSSPTPPTESSHTPTLSMDAMGSGGDTIPKDAGNLPTKTSEKSQKKPKGGRKTRERRKPTA